MASRVRQYGKRRGQDLAAAFSNLSLSSPKKDDILRSVLSPVNHNVGGKIVEESTKSEDKEPDKAETEEKILQKQEKRRRKPAVEAHIDHEYSALTLLDLVDPRLKSFQKQANMWEQAFEIIKIAQGSFAAILRMQLRKNPNQYMIGKLMPLKPKSGKGSRQPGHTSIEDATIEVRALSAMTQSPGFVEVRSAMVLKGSLPSQFRKAYEDWEKTLPEDKVEELGCPLDYPKEQLWLFIEMTDAGTDLENLIAKGFPDGERLHHDTDGRRIRADQAWDIFWGTVEALAHGEEHAKFEHRDLHPGNICVKKSTPIGSPPVDQNDLSAEKLCNGFEITLIDYTLARLQLEDGEVLANQMRDKSMFKQTSENKDDMRQYNIYRKMRDIFEGKTITKSDKSQKWEAYSPLTNVIWLHHVLTILLQETSIPSPSIHEEQEAGFVEGSLSSDMRERLKFLGQIHYKLDPERVDSWECLSAKELLRYGETRRHGTT